MPSSRISKLFAAAIFTGLVASCDDPTRPTIEASLEPRIQLIQADSATRASLVLPLTEVRVRTFGPTGRVVPLVLSAGVWRGTVTGLAAGDYEVVVEGIASGQVQYYGRLPNITIARGQRAQPTVAFAAAVPVVSNPPLNNTTNFSQRVPFASIPSATGYVVQISQSSTFASGVTEFTSADTMPLVNVTQPGTWYIRSRAILPQIPAASIPWSDVRSWIVIEASGGDDANDATPVPLNPEDPTTVGDRNITPTKREDWYDIEVEQGDSLFVETFAARLAFTSSLNTTLTLFENNGTTQVAQNLDAPGTTDSRLVYVAENSATYKLRVGATGGTSGHYELTSEIRRLPLAPTNLTTTIVSGTQVTLNWADNANNETSFRIERCEGAACTDFAEVGSTAPNVLTLAQASLTQGSTYRWRVRARNNVGNSAYTSIAAAALVGPAAPTDLAATTLSNTSIRLDWSDVANNETGYEIQRCTVGACTFATVGTVAADIETYTDLTAAYNTTYQYQIRATNAVVPSAFTAAVSANTIPPATPSALTAQVAGPTTINLSWTDNSSNETHFLIERCLGDGCGGFTQIDSVAAGVTNYVSTVAFNSAYRFRIRARNAVISQTYSGIADADTRPPAAPTGLAGGVQNPTAVALTWTDVADDETGYLIERCSSGETCTDFAALTTTAAAVAGFTDNTAVVNNWYRYRVTAVGVPGNSAPSNIITVRHFVPAAPSGLAAQVITANVIRLTWVDNADNETGYDLQRCTGAGCSDFSSVRTFASGVLTIDDSTASAGAEYTYRLRATNISGSSVASNTTPANTLPPNAPTALAASLISGSRVDLSWTNNDASITGTRVERCTGVACNNGDFAEIAFVVAPTAAHSDLTTTAGNYYRYRLRAQNAADVSVYTAIVDLDARFMTAPTGVEGSVSDPSPEISLTWSPSTGPGHTDYEILRCAGAGCTDFAQVGVVPAGQTFFTSGAQLGTEYRYTIRARNGVGAGPSSAPLDVNTFGPSAATGVTTELRPGVVRITWTDNSNNETQHVIERCEGGGCAGFAAISAVAANTTVYDDATAVAGTTYNYRIVATNLLGFENSAPASATPFVPVAPNNLAVTTASGTQINLTWSDNSLNEAGFEIRRCTTDGCSNFAPIDSVAAGVTSFSDLTVVQGQSYTYSVASFSAFGTSNASSEVTATTRLPNAPTNLVAQTLSNTSVRLTWTDNSDNETQFNIRQCAGAGCTPVDPPAVGVILNTTQFDVTGLSPNETYSFSVLAMNTVGSSAASGVATATTNLPAAPTPIGVNLDNGATAVQVTWTLVANATAYSIERCTGASCTNFVEIVQIPEDGSTSSYFNAGLTAGLTYRYRIAALNPAGNSEYSEIVTRTLAVPVAPTSLTVSVQPGFYALLNWVDNSDNESGFDLQRCVGLGCTDFASFTGVGAEQTGGIDNPLGFGDYRYRVRATNILGFSTFSNIVDLSFFPADAPTSLTATTFSATQIDLAWTDNGPYETGFEIQRCSGPGCSNFAVVDTAAANAVTYNDAGLTAGLTYTYRVRAFNVAGPSAFTNQATAATDFPAAPTNVVATIENPTDVTLSWTDVATNEDEYFIERCEGNSCNDFTFLAVVGAGVTSLQDFGLTTGNTYRYRVQASNGAGVSPFAPVAEAALVVPALPTGFTATVVNGNQIDLSWTDASNNELNFVVERCEGPGCSSFALLTSPVANAVSYTDAVTVESTYAYRMRAVNNVGASAYTASVAVNTIRPDLPTAFAVTTFSSTQIDLSWTDVATNESGYLVERCAGLSCTDFGTLVVLGENQSAYQDQSVSAQASYTYRITAFNVSGNRGAVGPLTATTFVPALPTGFAGVAQSATQINLSWTDVADNELGYRIERCAGGGCNTFVEVGTVGANQTAFSSTGLILNTVYRFRLRAFNAAGTSAYTPVLQVLTSAPANPSTLTATVLTANDVQLQFNDNSNNETGFGIQRCLGVSCLDFTDLVLIPGSTPASDVGPVTYVDNTLTFGQIARYRVRSFNNVGNSSSYTNIAEGSTQVPNAPSAAAAFPQGQTQIFIQWSDNATNEGGYIVERCTGETCTDFAPIDTIAAGSNNYTDATVTGGTFYRYRVRAIGNGTTSFGSSAYSNEALVSTIIPADPTALSAVPVSDNRVDLTWTNNANNADDFRIFRCAGAGCTPTDNIATTGSGVLTTFSDITVLANTLYRYAVSATNGAGESGLTNIAEAETDVPGLPASLVSTIISATEIQLTWTDNATTETGYEIERCEGAACTNFVLLTTTAADATSYNDTTVSASTVYRYRIRATTGSTFSGYTGPVVASTAPPTQPTSLIIVPNATDLFVQWFDAADDELSYEVERCTGTGCTDFVNVATLPANTTIFVEAWTVDTIYRYQVRAVNAAGVSAYTPILTQSTYRPAAPVGFTATTATASAIDLTWTPGSANTGGYRLLRCEGNGCTPTVVIQTLDSTATSYRNEPLTTGSEFTYDLQPFNIFGNGPLAGESSATTDFPNAPENLAATTLSATAIALQWDDLSSNETGFEVFRCAGDGCTPTDLITTTAADATGYSDASVAFDGVYRYHVRAINGAGASPVTGVAQANTQLPADPGIVNAVALSPTEIELTWTPRANTLQYAIERCDSPGCSSYTEVAVVPHPTTTFEDGPVLTGETYGYRVRGTNAVGASIPGAGVEVAMLPPAEVLSLTALPLSGTQIQVSWQDNSTNETGFVVERCTGGGCSSFTEVAVLPAGSTEYVDIDVIEDERYTYRVVAANNVGLSVVQPEVSAQTSVPEAPTGLAATTVAPGTIDVTWMPSMLNTLGISLERCSGADCESFTQIAVLGPTATSYQDAGLSTNVVWRYRVRAINNVGPSDYSNVGSDNTIVPLQVVGLTTTIVNDQRIDLAWADGGLEQEYVVERCLGNGCGGFTEIATLPQNSTSYSDVGGIAFNTAYTYRVVGRNVAGRGTASDPVVGITALNAPSVVTTRVMNRNDVLIQWDYTPSMQQYQFQLLRCAIPGCDPNSGSVVTTLPSGTVQYTDVVPQDRDLTYGVRAITVGGGTSSLTAGPPARTPINVTNAVAVTGISDAVNGERHYVFAVPADALAMRVRMTPANADPDLYVKFGSAPQQFQVFNDATNCVPFSGGVETCNFTAPAQGDWYVMVHGYGNSYTGAQFKASLAQRFGFTNPNGGGTGMPGNYLVAQPFTLAQPISATHLGAYVTTTYDAGFNVVNTPQNVKFGIYSNRLDGASQPQPNALLGQFTATFQPGLNEYTFPEITLAAGTYWIAILPQNQVDVTTTLSSTTNWRYLYSFNGISYASPLPANWPLVDNNTGVGVPVMNFFVRGFR